MIAKRVLTLSIFVLGAGVFLPCLAQAQNAAGLADIQKQLVSLYPTAKATADGKDLVTAGAVLVLQKDNLQMCKVDQPTTTVNYYRSGTISLSGGAGFFKALNAFGKLGEAVGAGPAPTLGETRTFVTGEKFFVTNVSTSQDGVAFTFMSDPIQDARYKGTLKFPFPKKGVVPSPDDMAAMVAEAIKLDAPAEAEQSAAPAAAAAPTKTIAIGQTRDEVIAMFGVPSKVMQVGAKEIDFFPDMKVTFIKNKVTNVE